MRLGTDLPSVSFLIRWILREMEIELTAVCDTDPDSDNELLDYAK